MPPPGRRSLALQLKSQGQPNGTQTETGRAVKVIIAGGGTGGHLFPAVAVGEEILRRCPDAEVLFVGTTNGMEAKWFPRSGFRYELLPVRGFAGKTPVMRLR